MGTRTKFRGLSSFDAYAKTLDDFRIKTSTGGTVTLLSFGIIVLLSLYEFIDYNTLTWKWELSVDKSRTKTLPIHFNITFPRVPCYLLSLDSVQANGEYQTNLESNIYKVRLDKEGKEVDKEAFDINSDKSNSDVQKDAVTKKRGPDYCGSCYGAGSEKQCCNTCDEIKSAYTKKGWEMTKFEDFEQCVFEGITSKMKQQQGEGCNIHGELKVKKIPGIFHIALGESFNFMGMHMHSTYGSSAYDYSHTINQLSFGELINDVKNPLDGEVNKREIGPIKFQYFLNVVATHLNYYDGRKIETNQYSVTQHEEDMSGEDTAGIPGVFFKFEISPMLVSAYETKKTFTSFLTSLCAIVGGILTIAGII
ncbi:endoplasmic reticulum-golgi intermediate compartment protein 3, partial [Neoconidiobolus thromboides FSU 785]